MPAPSPSNWDNQKNTPPIANAPFRAQERAKIVPLENHYCSCGDWQQSHTHHPPFLDVFWGGGNRKNAVVPRNKVTLTFRAFSYCCQQERVLCLRPRIHAQYLQAVKAALQGAARAWQGSRTSSWLGTLLPLTTFLRAKLPIYFLREIKINAVFL